jgi:N-acyl-D-aspartate/D-glutamate deacylase
MEGMKADILVFDENTIQDLSVYEKPHQFTKGMEYILVNGQLVLDKGNQTGVRSGQSIKSN